MARKVLLAMLLAVASYLAVAATWAWMAFPSAARALPQASAMPLSPRQAELLLKVEDPGFYHHSGLNIWSGQGLAAITSSLARSVYLGDTQFDGATGVFQRFYRAVFDCCKKIDIGRDVMAYYGKPLDLLTEQEFIGLVAMIKAPNLYHPVRNPAQFVQRLVQVNSQLRNQ